MVLLIICDLRALISYGTNLGGTNFRCSVGLSKASSLKVFLSPACLLMFEFAVNGR